ncbi:carbohydrate ABC transporter permease [Paenibacillus eucommiae]|uniref:Multiple sugar transport system permease protein n=1 Tax=Paenibacillus eucommiae TaxID=1355755 RepID=A0ABS4J3P5_9BACL|nr:sugar ABC transporter permease [Paenibacillus eucommiae]MBP1994425.1 multiple sugar transport system permease protein [Paenibacillus eucommiae]
MEPTVNASWGTIRKTRSRSWKIIPWLFVLPAIIFTVWLRYYPMMQAMYVSFFQYDVIHPPGKFIGLKNYLFLLNQEAYWDAWMNTLVFTALILIITFIPPIIQALLLSELYKGRKFFSTLFLIPALVPLSVNVILWKWIWHPDYGFANAVLKFLGLQPLQWLNDADLTKFSIIFPGIVGGGVAVLLYLAAIMGVAKEINEAASIDGCTGFRRMLYITLPNIRFLIFIQLIITVIGAFQLLDAPFQFTGGGPAGVSTSMGVFIYNTVQQDLSYGRANAASVLLFIVIAIITIFQVRMNKSQSE